MEIKEIVSETYRQPGLRAISNIDLCAENDKERREVFRVLKPGGRFAVSDVVNPWRRPEQVRRSMDAWVGSISGALHDNEYVGTLAKAGFDSIEIGSTCSRLC